MISLNVRALPVYIGGFALTAVATHTGLKAITYFVRALFDQESQRSHSQKTKPSHFWKGVQYSTISAASLYATSHFFNCIAYPLPQKEVPLNEEDFQVCRNQLREFELSSVYADMTTLPGIEKFCSEYFLSLEAYMHFLSTKEPRKEPLSYWLKRIQPSFSFERWKEDGLDLLQRNYDGHLKICQASFVEVKHAFKKEVLAGVTLDYSALCETYSQEAHPSCKKIIRMKKDLEKLYRKQSELDSLRSKIDEFYKIQKCGPILHLSGGESAALKSDFRKVICLKLPFNETSICEGKRI